MRDLTPKQARFVGEYPIDGNAIQAASLARLPLSEAELFAASMVPARIVDDLPKGHALSGRIHKLFLPASPLE